MSTKRKIAWAVTVAVFVAVAIAAAVGVVVGVVFHREPTLLRACWANGVAVLSPCERPTELRWAPDVRPLRWGVDPGLPPAATAELRAAVRDFNRQVGCEVFVPAAPPAAPDVAVTVDVAFGDGPVAVRDADGWVSFRGGPDGIRSARLELRSGLSGPEAYRVAFHELGHVAGLAHETDPGEWSVMSPTVPAGDDVRPVRLSDADAAAVRAELCRPAGAGDGMAVAP